MVCDRGVRLEIGDVYIMPKTGTNIKGLSRD